MLIIISSLKLSIVRNAAGPESWGHSRTAFANISMSNCFPSFIVHWILNFVDQPTHENHENWYPTNKSDFTVYISIHKQILKKIHDGHILLWQGINCQSSAVNFLHDPLLPLLFNIDKCPGLAHLTTSYQMCSPPYIHFCIHTSSYNIISHIYIYLSFICISIKTYSNRHTPV